MNMLPCSKYDPDKVFNRFQVVELPTSFVNLYTSLELDVGVDLHRSAYIKTSCNGLLMKFEDARELSPSHRAYKIKTITDTIIKIDFNPTNECITKEKYKTRAKSFVIDLRLIQVDGTRCCNEEYHSEIGRYYISGHFEHCDITHFPPMPDFGDIIMNTVATKHVYIRNNSSVLAAKVVYIKATGFTVKPDSFTLAPNTSKRLTISIKPVCLKFRHCCTFKIKNPDCNFTETSMEENTLTYDMILKLTVLVKKIKRIIVVESLHNITEPEIKYTWIGEEIKSHLMQKAKAENFFKLSKASRKIVHTKERFCTGTVRCYSEESVKIKPLRLPVDYKYNFCNRPPKMVDVYDVFNIFILPFSIDFGRIGLNTYAENEIIIKNNTTYNINLKLCYKSCITYTVNKLRKCNLNLVPFSEANITVYVEAVVHGIYEEYFEYIIDNRYHRKHPYKLNVATPRLMVEENLLKFGMVTNESFVISVPMRISNNFNVPVIFNWEGIHVDTPFEIIPNIGTIPRHTSMMVDIIYVSKQTKSKVHEVDLISNSSLAIPIELNVLTRKLSIKFLQPAVLFKDVALNLETVEKVKLENSSREMALFYVVEPLIPGVKIEPINGAIRPKMVTTFTITVQIACILEFAFDICVKINNKENVILPVSGNIIEPKILISPKNIYMARIPSNMVTYVPVTLQNVSSLRSTIDVLDTGDDNMFNVYITVGCEKKRVFKFWIDGGQSKTVFIKVYDIFRREYEMFIPFKINGLLGPPDNRACTTELRHYIGIHEGQYENNIKVKLKTLIKDISFCRIIGVITVPWIELSVDKFEIDYVPFQDNSMEFTITNVSKYHLYISIVAVKLAPSFSLSLQTEENSCASTDVNIHFELVCESKVALKLNFHPKSYGRHVATALLFLDKHMTIPYYNLTFIGKRQTPVMRPSTYGIIFPPCQVGTKMSRSLTVRLKEQSEKDEFYCMCKGDTGIKIDLTDCEYVESLQESYTIVTVEITVFSESEYSKKAVVVICHISGSGCDIEVSFCFTKCVLTVHSNFLVPLEDHPYPYFPTETQQDLYHYMNSCVEFLEKWMFQQGFRRDLYPVIPDTFHAISSSLYSAAGIKFKGMNVSILNFMRRIAGPLMKHLRKVSGVGVDESHKNVKEIHDNYNEIVKLLKSRGSSIWGLKAMYLLSHEQLIVYCENVPINSKADEMLTQQLLEDVNLYERLNKQCWVDFILQIYKVFVMDTCFFECICLTNKPRDMVEIIVAWYNEQIENQHVRLRGRDKPVKVITNITTDLSDGIAVISAIINFCPFMKEYFTLFCERDENNGESCIINNACLIIEVLNQLRFYFPITSKDFLQPNFLQMLFFSVHLIVTLPMFKPKAYVQFKPPLLRSSTRQLGIYPTSLESLTLSCVVLNNNRNNFVVEKAAPGGDNGKKMYISVKYTANFVKDENAILLVHGYNKTRIFDTYIIFVLDGSISSLNPHRKCRVTGPLYRPIKVDIHVSSPFLSSGTYKLYLTDTEPTIPVKFEDNTIPKFYVQRLTLVEKEIYLHAMPKDIGTDVQEHKLYMQIICLSTQVGNSWIWFTGDNGDFFIKVTSQPRWDTPLDTMSATLRTDTCTSERYGESTECYRFAIMIPHRNELMVKALRHALSEYASPTMMKIFDVQIETATGKSILKMLFSEDGTNMTDVQHILHNEISYNISSRFLRPCTERVTLHHHTSNMCTLPILLPGKEEIAEKYTLTLTSDCGLDIRTYRIIFIVTNDG